MASTHIVNRIIKSRNNIEYLVEYKFSWIPQSTMNANFGAIKSVLDSRKPRNQPRQYKVQWKQTWIPSTSIKRNQINEFNSMGINENIDSPPPTTRFLAESSTQKTSKTNKSTQQTNTSFPSSSNHQSPNKYRTFYPNSGKQQHSQSTNPLIQSI